jgi:hypothetical protein
VNPYATAAAFKQAVETRLRATSSSGTDFARRRQLLVFDRFLARITRELGDSVILKGGLVVELRVERARTTRDIDLAWADLATLTQAVEAFLTPVLDDKASRIWTPSMWRWGP